MPYSLIILVSLLLASCSSKVNKKTLSNQAVVQANSEYFDQEVNSDDMAISDYDYKNHVINSREFKGSLKVKDRSIQYLNIYLSSKLSLSLSNIAIRKSEVLRQYPFSYFIDGTIYSAVIKPNHLGMVSIRFNDGPLERLAVTFRPSIPQE